MHFYIILSFFIVVTASTVYLTWLYYLATCLVIALICVISACLYKKYGCVCLHRKPITPNVKPMVFDTRGDYHGSRSPSSRAS